MRRAVKSDEPAPPARNMNLTVVADQSAIVDRLRLLERAELLAMYDAAGDVIECVAALAERGKNPVTEVLESAGTVEEWAHFPAGDVIDPVSHSQFYYHAHAAEERASGEHGHFHTFVRPKKLFPDLAPVAVAESMASIPEPAWVTHLAGLSTDASGHLIRLFTTNRWVTDEAWYAADAVIDMLDRFDIAADKPSLELNRWVSAVIRMFRPQIADLLRARDEAVARWQTAHPERDVFEDRELQVISQTTVDFLAHIRAIEAALASTPA
ncbi:MAG: hypothetical protein K9G60_03965 [Pseudolabrys sp.]|nr:hypothetical protein [Pseudolabrys sp.]